MDSIAIISFLIGLENLDMNVSQSDVQEVMQTADSAIQRVVKEIHDHLQQQDEKIDKIMEVLNNARVDEID